MSQSRTHSSLEAWANTLIGYLINLFAQMAIFPLYGRHVTVSENIQIGLFFLVISVVRGYSLRRLFNLFH